MRVALVAGEHSGDRLGAGLIRAIRARCPEAEFDGVGGPLMQAEGLRSHYPMEALSVMGLVEVLRHLPRLLRIRRDLVARYRTDPPDVFVGIDLPDFNLSIERRLKAVGVPTVHYVSPQVWAWRQGRVRTIGRSVDRILALYPFEAEFYRRHGVPVDFVGHPAADRFPLQPDAGAARAALGLVDDGGGPWVALLPGSRLGEVQRHAELYARTVARLRERQPDVRFIAPLAWPGLRAVFYEALVQQGVSDAVQLFEGRADEVMAAADVVLTASGTATLEAMLLKRPMVVAYRLAPLTFWLMKRLVRVSHVSQPNLLAGEGLVEEYLQDAATPDNLAYALYRLLNDEPRSAYLRARFAELHGTLRRGADGQAAAAVLAAAGGNGS
ncbi:lipid-A-disaccharide synthase [Alkalilimnicola ehrlichii MLHE-1]|uniref:Lipid-A-disaccharide synthase n=1 Tax=Alkalilimnicola ehrlichii (strain ATCC BAA-1101 / DSM 17681 / MLHE-1) TaxID=187272 RepID=LPXB_ALKEH|nr:lipid-A-disaccharide synthase [Alkalilimnicola ehrlichii]Q0A7J2.1 RecName: Full=Lipid-A-disaccharide synthase [Alkalilimnicola ehrlichii MLHE-1]ABI57195.1 lipid-A-disaccharide synthase [Alkalilimnicola ehrlichii MLHE-1]